MINRKNRHFIWVIFLVIIYSSSLGWCNKTPLMYYAEEFLKKSGAPGVSISVMKKGQRDPVTVALGYACIENRVKMRPDTVMKVGSITKVFTGILIHILMEKGKLSYDSQLASFFPSYHFHKDITVKNLLSHTSGLIDIFNLSEVLSNLCKPWTPEEILKMAANHPLEFLPGTKAKYCNTGFVALGIIAQKIEGVSFFQAVMTEVAKPLGIKLLYQGDDTSIIPNESCGYTKDKNGNLRKPILCSMVPAFATGNFMTTSSELVKLVNVDMLLKHKLLDISSPHPCTLKNGSKAEKKVKLSGMSYEWEFYDTFFIFRLNGKPMTVIGKFGTFPGFVSCFLYDPASKYAVSITTNLETSYEYVFQTAIKILKYKRGLDTKNKNKTKK